MDIQYYKTASGREPVREYINNLSPADIYQITGDLELIRDCGIHDTPVITRKLIEKLWEIITGTRHQQRVFYCIISGRTLILLHACKEQKEGAQQKDVKLAHKRMREVLS